MISSVNMGESIFEIKWVQIVISVISLGVIIGIYIGLKNATFDWSVSTIGDI